MGAGRPARDARGSGAGRPTPTRRQAASGRACPVIVTRSKRRPRSRVCAAAETHSMWRARGRRRACRAPDRPRPGPRDGRPPAPPRVPVRGRRPDRTGDRVQEEVEVRLVAQGASASSSQARLRSNHPPHRHARPLHHALNLARGEGYQARGLTPSSPRAGWPVHDLTARRVPDPAAARARPHHGCPNQMDPAVGGREPSRAEGGPGSRACRGWGAPRGSSGQAVEPVRHLRFCKNFSDVERRMLARLLSVQLPRVEALREFRSRLFRGAELDSACGWPSITPIVDRDAAQRARGWSQLQGELA